MHFLCKSLIRGVALAGLVAAWFALRGRHRRRRRSRQRRKAPVASRSRLRRPGHVPGLSRGQGRRRQDGPHARAFNPRTPAATKGCESCHGPGKAHAEAGGDKTKIAQLSKLGGAGRERRLHELPRPQDARPVGRQPAREPQRRLHAAATASTRRRAKATAEGSVESELCATCHRNIVNKQNRFNHMPVREGKMSCSSCHNVHGSPNVKLLKAGTTVDESCTSCHAEKRGPFLWEHAPVADSCATCHDPHGSNNDRMLVAKQPFLCQRCHVTSRHPPTVYDGYLLKNSQNANKIYGRSCVVCHQHGSRLELPERQGVPALREEDCDAQQSIDGDCGASARLRDPRDGADEARRGNFGHNRRGGDGHDRCRGPRDVGYRATRPASSGTATCATGCSPTSSSASRPTATCST